MSLMTSIKKMSEPLLIELEHRDDICILHLKGRVVTTADPELIHVTDEIKSRNCYRLLVDLRDVLMIGSTGIGFLVGLYTSITKIPGGRFVLVSPNQRVRDVLDLTRLSTIIQLAPDMASGLAALHAESGQVIEMDHAILTQ